VTQELAVKCKTIQDEVIKIQSKLESDTKSKLNLQEFKDMKYTFTITRKK